MTDRYFVESPIRADRATLVGPEAHHLIHVMRAGPGDAVVLFDGSGAEFDAVVERSTRAEVELAVRSRREVDRESPRALTLAVALPKGDRQKWLVEKAVELGVRRMVPLADRARRGPTGRPGARAAASHGDRGLEAMRPQPADGDRRAANPARTDRRHRRRAVPVAGASAADIGRWGGVCGGAEEGLGIGD